MTLEEQFSRIIIKERKNELTPFLQQLTAQTKKSLVPHLKSLNEEYHTYKEVKRLLGTTFEKKGTDEQSRMLGIASFVCFNRSDFQRTFFWSIILNGDALNNVLEWYRPKWFGDYINSFGSARFVPLNYIWLMEIAGKGYVTPSPELIVKILPDVIFETIDRKNRYVPEKLLTFSETLNEHIWYFFQFESHVHPVDKYKQVDPATTSEGFGWIHALSKFSREGRIDRKQLLKESISATTRNFNKALTSWFAELFLTLEASKAELLSVQKELFTMFNAAHSKPVNAALQSFKKIIDDKNFDADNFIGHANTLLSSKTKTVISSALLILEKIARKQRDKAAMICEAVCHAFIFKDEEMQMKAANIIMKYGDVSEPLVTEAVSRHSDSMLAGPRNLLSDYLIKVSEQDDVIAEDENEVNKATSFTNDLNPVAYVDNIDDLVFLASQAFDNNESYHFDLLPASLIKLQHAMRGNNIAKLEPALQRAYKLITNTLISTSGWLDHMLARFFIDYTKFLIAVFPTEAASLQGVEKIFVEKEKENLRQWPGFNSRLSSLREWRLHDNNIIYQPFRHLLLVALDKLINNDTLPLLSAITHAPAWIDPVELIDRIHAYQFNNKEPDNMDFQLAISRCSLDKAIYEGEYANKKLKGEYLDLIIFLLNKDVRPNGSLNSESLWMMAGVTKTPYLQYEEFKNFSCNKLNRTFLTGQFSWQSLKEDFTYQQYNYTLGRHENISDSRYVLRINIEDKIKIKKEPVIKNLMSRFFGSKENDHKLLYEFIEVKSRYFDAEVSDIKRWFTLIPNNPKTLVAQLAKKSLVYSTFAEEANRKIVIATLQTLFEIKKKHGMMGHLFVATCMICNDKTAAAFASEIWINGLIDSKVLGEIIGVHQRNEFAPLKRFTDLIMNHLFQVSKKHSLELEQLLISLIRSLPDEPVKNLKKLLEIYSEVLSINNSSVQDDVLKQLLMNWKETASLSKIVVRLEQAMPYHN